MREGKVRALPWTRQRPGAFGNHYLKWFGEERGAKVMLQHLLSPSLLSKQSFKYGFQGPGPWRGRGAEPSPSLRAWVNHSRDWYEALSGRPSFERWRR